MENKKEVTGLEIVGNLSTLGLSIGMVFFRILLLTIVWDWFIADKLFDISYWGMFLLVAILGFFTGGNVRHFTVEGKFKKIFEKDEQLSWEDKIIIHLKGLGMSLLQFGVIWLVYVIIT